MDKKSALREIGLSEGESLVYLALLKIGESNVNKIKKETKIHRTTIYDFLDSLIKKALVSYVVKNKVKFYSAARPERLSSIIKEKQEILNKVMPELIGLVKIEKKSLQVEIYEGEEGFKTFCNTMLKERKEILALGVNEAQFEEKFPHIMRSYFKKEQKAGIKERLIAEKGTKFVYKERHIQYRYMEKKFFNPTPTAIFGDYVAIVIWEPLTTIMIKNKELADAYRKYFNLLWKLVK